MNKNRNRHTGKVNEFKRNILQQGKKLTIGLNDYAQLNNTPRGSAHAGTIVRVF